MNTVSTLALNLALNNRGIYGVTIVDTMENNNGLDVEFKRPDCYYKGSIVSWVLGEEITPEETHRLVARAFAMPRKRMALRATFIK